MHDLTNRKMAVRLGVWGAFSALLVSIYLILAGGFLLLTKRIRLEGLRQIIRSYVRPLAGGAMADIQAELGICYTSWMPSYLVSDAISVSWVQVFEDGKPIGPPHSAHSAVREEGLGRFSHWGSRLYFSTSDNSDPRTNGRKYSWKEVRP